MDHQQYKDLLLLSLYNELESDESSLLDKHLETCSECAGEVQQLKKFHTALASHRPVPVSEMALAEARAELRVALRQERTRRAWWQDAADAVADLLTPGARIAVGAAALLTVGVGLGYFAFKQPAPNSLNPLSGGLQEISSMPTEAAIEQGESQITNVRFINKDLANGEVEFEFNAVTPVHIKGNVNDERVQKMLARAIVSERNVGTRLRAVNFIGDQSKDQPEPIKVNKEVKDALIAALKFDDNFGVKKEALRILQKYLPDPDVTNAIIYVLKYVKNTGLKIAAINSLDMSKFTEPNQDLLAMLREKADSEENSYVRIKAKAALQEVRQ